MPLSPPPLATGDEREPTISTDAVRISVSFMRHRLRNQEDYWVEHDRPHVNKTERGEAAAGEEGKA